MNNFISDLKYRYSIIKYVNRFGVIWASNHFSVSHSFIYKLFKRFDGFLDSIKPFSGFIKYFVIKRICVFNHKSFFIIPSYYNNIAILINKKGTICALTIIH